MPREVKSFRNELPVPSGKKPSVRAAMVERFGEQAVDDLKGGAVAADGEKIAGSFAVGVARDFGGFAGARGLRDG